jgi:hypothetical protein
MQSGIFLQQYGTEMTDAGMPMSALVLRMLMPTYGNLLFFQRKLMNCFMSTWCGEPTMVTAVVSKAQYSLARKKY